MRLWPLPVGTLLPGIGFDKADRPSGTSYQVFLFSFGTLRWFSCFMANRAGPKSLASGLGGHGPSYLLVGVGRREMAATGDADPGHRVQASDLLALTLCLARG